MRNLSIANASLPTRGFLNKIPYNDVRPLNSIIYAHSQNPPRLPAHRGRLFRDRPRVAGAHCQKFLCAQHGRPHGREG